MSDTFGVSVKEAAEKIRSMFAVVEKACREDPQFAAAMQALDDEVERRRTMRGKIDLWMRRCSELFR